MNFLRFSVINACTPLPEHSLHIWQATVHATYSATQQRSCRETRCSCAIVHVCNARLRKPQRDDHCPLRSTWTVQKAQGQSGYGKQKQKPDYKTSMAARKHHPLCGLSPSCQLTLSGDILSSHSSTCWHCCSLAVGCQESW